MDFTEKNLSKNFCNSTLKKCLDLIRSSSSFNLVALPSVGISFFVRYLSSNPRFKFININTYELPEFTKDYFFEQFAKKTNERIRKEDYLDQARSGLEKLAKKNEKIVIIINRIDRLAPLLDQSFFDNIRYLRDADRSKIVITFVSSTPILELSSGVISDSFSASTNQVFFKPYSVDDMIAITRIDGTLAIKPKALDLCGGHHSLFQTLQRCQSLENPMSDPMVELVIKDIYQSLNAKRREQLLAIAMGKKTTDTEFLYDIGLIYNENGDIKFFSDLLRIYLEHHGKLILPLKEKRLLALLKRYPGKIVKKQDILDYIWGDEIASDWALNSLVYRLRKNPAFDSSRYSIKSVKKDGYILEDSYS